MSSAKIYVYCLPGGLRSGDVIGFAIAEDGECLAQHLSSNPEFAKHDMGLTSKWKHDLYATKYPDGYTLEWINEKDLDAHTGFQAAFVKNKEGE